MIGVPGTEDQGWGELETEVTDYTGREAAFANAELCMVLPQLWCGPAVCVVLPQLWCASSSLCVVGAAEQMQLILSHCRNCSLFFSEFLLVLYRIYI